MKKAVSQRDKVHTLHMDNASFIPYNPRSLSIMRSNSRSPCADRVLQEAPPLLLSTTEKSLFLYLPSKNQKSREWGASAPQWPLWVIAKSWFFCVYSLAHREHMKCVSALLIGLKYKLFIEEKTLGTWRVQKQIANKRRIELLWYGHS